MQRSEMSRRRLTGALIGSGTDWRRGDAALYATLSRNLVFDGILVDTRTCREGPLNPAVTPTRACLAGDPPRAARLRPVPDQPDLAGPREAGSSLRHATNSTTCSAITSSGTSPGSSTSRCLQPGMFGDEWGVVWNKTVDRDIGVPANRVLPERDLARARRARPARSPPLRRVAGLLRGQPGPLQALQRQLLALRARVDAARAWRR